MEYSLPAPTCTVPPPRSPPDHRHPFAHLYPALADIRPSCFASLRFYIQSSLGPFCCTRIRRPGFCRRGPHCSQSGPNLRCGDRRGDRTALDRGAFRDFIDPLRSLIGGLWRFAAHERGEAPSFSAGVHIAAVRANAPERACAPPVGWRGLPAGQFARVLGPGPGVCRRGRLGDRGCCGER
jgi:hypothetical protein